MQSWVRNDRILISWDNVGGPLFKGLLPDPAAIVDLTHWSARSSPDLTRVTEVPGLDLPEGAKTAMRVIADTHFESAYNPPLHGNSGYFESDIQPIPLDEISYVNWHVWLSPGETGGTGVWVVGVRFYGGGYIVADPDAPDHWYDPVAPSQQEIDIEGGWALSEGRVWIPHGVDGITLYATATTHSGDEGTMSGHLYLTDAYIFAEEIVSTFTQQRYHHYVVSRCSPGGPFSILGKTQAMAYLDVDVAPNQLYTYKVQGTNKNETYFEDVDGVITAGGPFYPPDNTLLPIAPGRLMATPGKTSVLWEWYPASTAVPEDTLAYFMYDSSTDQPKYVIWAWDAAGNHVTEWREKSS